MHANRISQAREIPFLEQQENDFLNNVKIGSLSIQIQDLYH